MLNAIKTAIARKLSPETTFKVRSLKRALLGQPRIDRNAPGVMGKPTDPKILQSIALEKYIGGKISAPYLFFDEEEILLLPAKEIARTLTLSVSYINSAHVNGDVAEFGTMGGFTARTLAAAMVYDPRRQPIAPDYVGENPFRKLRLFDSFEGLPEITSDIDIESPHVASGTWSKGGCKVLGARELRAMVERVLPPERIEITEGWFADTVKALPDNTRFAMIHFDGDLYQSTIDALVPCFARGFVSRGAVLCFDDWNCNRSLPEYGERRAWAELVERFEIQASHCGDYSASGTKFIIHSYKGIHAADLWH